MPRIVEEANKPSPRDIKLSDGGEGVVVGKHVYRKTANGQRVKLGVLDDNGKIVPDEKGKKK